MVKTRKIQFSLGIPVDVYRQLVALRVRRQALAGDPTVSLASVVVDVLRRGLETRHPSGKGDR